MVREWFAIKNPSGQNVCLRLRVMDAILNCDKENLTPLHIAQTAFVSVGFVNRFCEYQGRELFRCDSFHKFFGAWLRVYKKQLNDYKECKRKKEVRVEERFKHYVEFAGLTKATTAWLTAREIFFKTELAKYSFVSLSEQIGMSERRLKELTRFLDFNGLSFGKESIPQVLSISDSSWNFDVKKIPLERKIDELHLPIRTRNCLEAADIITLGDLVLLDKNELLKFRNFGRKSLTELEYALNELITIS